MCIRDRALAAEEENSCKRKKEVIEKIRSLAKSAQNWKEANKEFNALLEAVSYTHLNIFFTKNKECLKSLYSILNTILMI